MSLAKPREGKSFGFHIYSDSSDEYTLGNPETIIWSSIRHLCSASAARGLASRIYGLSKRRERDAAAWNIKLYIQQASEFYEAATSAKPNTAPLIYYYAFLNLAKAVCELHRPLFHQREESYAHGLGWKPDTKKLVDLSKEFVTVRGKGVWHVLWESLMGRPCPATNRTSLSIRRLFSYCPEISAEFRRVFPGPVPLLELKEPAFLYDKAQNEAWIRFSVERGDLKNHGISGPLLVRQIQSPRSGYVEVKAKDSEDRTFQSVNPKKLNKDDTPWSVMERDVAAFNLIASFGRGREMKYSIPLQTRLPLPLPQLIVSYTLLFWLGSLVRYDPHSVHALMDSEYWILIDGFMTQSRVWLLELFEWAFYQTETTLCTAR